VRWRAIGLGHRRASLRRRSPASCAIAAFRYALPRKAKDGSSKKRRGFTPANEKIDSTSRSVRLSVPSRSATRGRKSEREALATLIWPHPATRFPCVQPIAPLARRERQHDRRMPLPRVKREFRRRASSLLREGAIVRFRRDGETLPLDPYLRNKMTPSDNLRLDATNGEFPR